MKIKEFVPVGFVPTFTIIALFCSAKIGDRIYRLSQNIVAKNLPRFFRPDGYNVFIDGGAKDSCGFKPDFNAESAYKTWAKKRKKAKAQEAEQAQARQEAQADADLSPKEREWKITKNTARQDLQALAAKNPTTQFKIIREWLEQDKNAYELFGFSSSINVDTQELKKKFRLLSLQYHPDKFQNLNDKAEAAIYFRMLNEARLYVDENILAKRPT